MTTYKHQNLTTFCSAAICLVAFIAAAAPVAKLPSVLTDNMVVQSGKPMQVWGTDVKAGAAVSVALTDEATGKAIASTTVKADADGSFAAALPAMEYRQSAMTLTLSSPGFEDVVRKNILVGEVWVCSGQSNMAWPLRMATDGVAFSEAATNSLIRLFHVQAKPQLQPTNDFAAKWAVCTPATALSFSAIGYFFGEELHRELPGNPPIGLISIAWSGMPAQSFVSYDALNANGFTNYLSQYEKVLGNMDDSTEAMAKYEGQLAAHKASSRFEDKSPPESETPEMAAPGLDASGWKTATIPSSLEKMLGDATFNGAVWFRRTIDIPPEWFNEELMLELGPIDDFDTTYFNGKLVGSTGKETPGYWTALRKYRIPADLVNGGKAVITVRVLDNYMGGSFGGSPMLISPVKGENTTPIKLAGEWQYKIDYAVKEVPEPMKPGLVSPNTPSSLFNAFVEPIRQFPAAGVIWYQGESNAGASEEYRRLFKTLIRDWRAAWGDDTMAFLWCQLANFMQRSTTPVDTAWAGLRNAQSSALELPLTGQAVIADVGDPNDIHPRDKQTPAHRLALAALHVLYGREDIVHSGPTLKSIEALDGTLVLDFDNIGGGLVAKDGKLAGFAVSGTNDVYRWAQAEIDGSRVILSSETIPLPVKVRYAWDNDPEITLYNKEGLPASPFKAETK